MSEGTRAESVTTFFYAWFAFTLALFPLVATIDSAFFASSLGSSVVLVGSIVASLPAALEFLFSDRNPRRVAAFVVVFAFLYLLAILIQAGVYVSLGETETITAVEFAVLFVTYAVAYGLVYRVGVGRYADRLLP